MKENLKFYKIAILSDLIGLELSKNYIDSVLNPEAQSKLRSLKKSTDLMSKFVDDSFKDKDQKIHEAFGDLCDGISSEIDRILKEIVK